MEELATGFGLVEGPTWINDRGLLFSDVIKGGVYLLDHLNNVSPTQPDTNNPANSIGRIFKQKTLPINDLNNKRIDLLDSGIRPLLFSCSLCSMSILFIFCILSSKVLFDYLFSLNFLDPPSPICSAKWTCWMCFCYL